VSEGAPSAGAPVEDILASIRRAMAEPAATPLPAPQAPTSDDDDVLELTRPIPAQAEAPRPPERAALVSPDAAEASRHALAALSRLKLTGGDPADDTLGGLVRELLRPMLKTWLDAELPAIVERLVLQEIARLTAPRD